MAAALNVCEPCSTGIGGDAFALYYERKFGKVSCMQGNGASSRHLRLDTIDTASWRNNPRSGLCVTVPGAAALWEDMVRMHGRLSLSAVLEPAICLAEEGFPIAPVTSNQWRQSYLQGHESIRVFRPREGFPSPGEIFRNPDLAATFRRLGRDGAAAGFYSGPVAEAIVAAVHEYDGLLDLEDMAAHNTAFEDPVSVLYKDVRVYQTPPPSHGLAVLVALALRAKVQEASSIPEPHLSIECMRISFVDALQYISDPRDSPEESRRMVQALLSDEYLTARARLVTERAVEQLTCGDLSPFLASDTVYFCCVDNEGNAASFINSNYMGFGTGISPQSSGFTLHNRGFNFNTIPGHVNCVGPSKRPYHTIIPGLAVNEADGSLYAVFGNMGGFMQPMGHLQLLTKLIDGGMDPQQAVDSPRWYLTPTGATQSAMDMSESEVQLEEGYDEAVAEDLRRRGHLIGSTVRGIDRALFGRAQVIQRRSDGCFWAGSDPRSDGCAIPYVKLC